MRTVSKAREAYLTVYLSLIMGVVLSFLMILIEGAQVGASRLKAEMTADLGLDSVFAEYHRELLDQYGLFFIDTSYGNVQGGIGLLQEHLSDYMGYNLAAAPLGANNLVRLSNPYLEIEEAAFASDEKGAVWKAQAVEYMKAYYGADLAERIRDRLSIIEEQEWITFDTVQEAQRLEEAFEQGLQERQITEVSTQTQEGYSYSQVASLWDSLQGKGVLQLVMQDTAAISEQIIEQEQYISARISQGNYNRGCGLRNKKEGAQAVLEEVLFQEYLIQKYGNYTEPKEEGVLSYQIEYILFGKESDVSNLRECAERLVLLRAASNYWYLTTQDSFKAGEVKTVATVICALLGAPELSQGLEQLMLAVWSFAEGVADVRTLFDGGSVPLLKEKEHWQTSFWNLLSGSWTEEKTKHAQDGWNYEDYLRALLYLQQSPQKVLRSMDIAEMDIRQTEGNAHFRIDRCVDYIKADFGFADSGGHEFVFQRTFCYE